MAKSWYGLRKAAEECCELGVELMKLATFPNGKHPARKKSLVLSTEDECADVLAAVNFFIDRKARPCAHRAPCGGQIQEILGLVAVQNEGQTEEDENRVFR